VEMVTERRMKVMDTMMMMKKYPGTKTISMIRMMKRKKKRTLKNTI
jgi:hypothetical protein